ncbi:hypothetical protein C0V70_13100 [Bacteriovorax stolpii]|uniref:Uncharacterized protein n=1 Tax=Bacteriovorax stolpii TaxID=960 RepID=A0A2K9NU24_BACTC|nr:hypothetical protein [Bacteriovorax stolpii]AUN99021.1 hypothetical protein C0V70_13100 [Bacteriovorax stolpii]TDP55453.1 hypothetical protein C8D79_0503 [Bacteriovorax stolpii]
MKTKNIKMNKAMAVLAVIATISFSQMTMAQEEISLPVITKPAILEEGTQRELSASQVAELLPWAKDSKIFLSDLLDNVQTLAPSDKVDHLVEGIKSVVGESAPKNSELLMRYALNRGLVINDILIREVEANSVGMVDVQLRVLKASILMAIKYYDQDMEMMSKKAKTSFAAFGLDYYDFLSELNKSVFDASAQYSFQRTALEFLQWDLYRDLNNTVYANQIVKINNGLKTFPTKKLTDSQSIALIRQMKSLAKQLKVTKEIPATPAKSPQEFEALMAKKMLVSSIDEGVMYAVKAMELVSTPTEFFRAISPEITNPNANYTNALAAVGYNSRNVLLKNSMTRVADVHKLASIQDSVDNIIVITREYTSSVRTAAEFLALYSYTVSNPSSYYKSELKQLTMANMSYFMGLNPTTEERNTLLGRF